MGKKPSKPSTRLEVAFILAAVLVAKVMFIAFLWRSGIYARLENTKYFFSPLYRMILVILGYEH